MLLSDHGADVVRVDLPAYAGKRSRQPILHRGRRSVAINLKSPDGADVARRLIDRADAVIEGFRPGVTERLGLGPDDCLARNPRLVYGRMTGWGQDGPLAQAPGHDINYIAVAGVLDQIGEPEGVPVPPLNLAADMGGGGMLLAFGLATALLAAQRTGVGQVVEAAMTDGSVSLMALILDQLASGQWTDGRDPGNFIANAPYYHVYRCADGGYAAVGCVESQFYAAMLRVLGLEDDPVVSRQRDKAAWPAMTARIAAVFSTRSRDEWTARFEGEEACVTPVLSLAEAAGHPHNVKRGTYFTDPAGRLHPAPAPRFAASSAPEPVPAAAVGAHTREVLTEIGLTGTEVDDLRDGGVIGCADTA
jgi:alpha-methylacyl-CoA racemase